MSKLIEIAKYSYEFATKKSKTKSASCKGTLHFFVNQLNGSILKWYVTFSEVNLDLLTTESWFGLENSNFRARESLFKAVFGNDTCQKARTKENRNEIKELENDELIKLNKWFRQNYKSTFKNIIAILSGNNPTGSFSSPKNAQVQITNEKNISTNEAGNFIMFFDQIKDLTYSYIDQINEDVQEAKETYIEFIKSSCDENKEPIFAFLKNMFVLLTKEEQKTREELKSLQNKIKNVIGKLILEKQKVFAKINTYRNSASKRKVQVFTIDNSNIKPENAHIKNVSDIKNEIWNKILQLVKINDKKIGLSNLNTDKFLEKAKQEIDCDDNLLNLTPNVHQMFDKNVFTYDSENGKIIWSQNAKSTEIEKNFEKIPDQFLTKERKKFLKQRNNLLQK
ncbi:MAG4270 family putative restriction endonuclease [Mycoplasmopsis hyopharyngis]|uniref:MAG4270 family putative restriction endonuclease n=1 Tax=Mycoplasmopsis hyopharyngis TaxID=29558 RepID=UPI003872C488